MVSRYALEPVCVLPFCANPIRSGPAVILGALPAGDSLHGSYS
jgi:hypothetical protein